MKRNSFKDIAFILVVVLVLLGTVMILVQSAQPKERTTADIKRLFEQEKVDSFVIEGDILYLKLKDGTQEQKQLYSVNYFREDLDALIQEQYAAGTITDYEYDIGFVPPWWLMIVPYILLFVIFIALWYFMFNKGGGGDKAMRFGKARTRSNLDEKKKVTFNDVAGADEEKAELQEIVDFLKNPRKFIDIGARIPKGVLLVGPPGTGKTLIAKAVAGEAGTQFLSISGSDFVELYVGVGASRVRDLFEQAKKTSPSIVFIDEIDAVGRHRGAGMGGGHDEREQTLNQLLVEMDGFGSNEGVIIIAATNRPDILDPALLRPGRFDRQVYVGYPDIKGREAILKVHAKGKMLDSSVKLDVVAKGTPGFTGADLENLLNEAALLAARHNKKAVSSDDLEEAKLKVRMGPEKKSRVITERERKLTAYHEAGHAVVSKFLPTADPVHHVTIVPRGAAGGMTMHLPQEDRMFQTRSELYEHIVIYMGGRVAEHIVLNEISSGAGHDIQQATKIARQMITRFGMSDKMGPVSYGSDNDEVFLGRDYGHTSNLSTETANRIDDEVRALIERAYNQCESILREQIQALHDMANYLLEYESIDGITFNTYFETGEFPARSKKKDGKAAFEAKSESLDEEILSLLKEDAEETKKDGSDTSDK